MVGSEDLGAIKDRVTGLEKFMVRPGDVGDGILGLEIMVSGKEWVEVCLDERID